MVALLRNIFFQNSEDRVKMIIEAPLKRTFLFIATPTILTMIIQSIMPILDGLIVYNYDSPVSGAAISMVASFHNIFIISAKGLSVAGGAVVGRINGTGNFKRGKSVSGQLISLTVLMSVILMPLLILIAYLVALNNTDPELSSKIITYNAFLIFSIPFISLQNTYNSLKSVFGQPQMALIRTILFVPIKIFCSYFFIVVLDLGIMGAALATVSAYLTISIFIIYDLFLSKSAERLSLKDLALKKDDCKKIISKSLPAMVQNSTKQLSFFLVTLQLAKFQSNALAANNIAGNINQIYNSFIGCYEAAIISFVSINLGAKNIKRAKQASNFALKISVTTAIFFTVVSFFISPFLISLYTNDPELISISLTANKYYNLGLIGFAFMFSQMPVFIAIGRTMTSLIIQFARIWVIRLGFLGIMNIFSPETGLVNIFVSFTVANICGGIISHIFYRKINWPLAASKA